MFFPISIIVILIIGDRDPKCYRCYQPLYRTGNFLHVANESKGFIFNFFNTKYYDVKSAEEIRCYSSSCHPKNELFQTKFKKDYVFLRKDEMLKKFNQDKHLITNLDQLDLMTF